MGVGVHWRVGWFSGLLARDSSHLCSQALLFALSTSLFVMPLQVLSLDEKTAALAAMDADLKALLVAHRVSDDIAAVLSHAEIRSVTLFSSMADDTATFRTWAKVDVGLDNGLAASVSVGKLAEAWEDANSRCKTPTTS